MRPQKQCCHPPPNPSPRHLLSRYVHSTRHTSGHANRGIGCMPLSTHRPKSMANSSSAMTERGLLVRRESRGDAIFRNPIFLSNCSNLGLRSARWLSRAAVSNSTPIHLGRCPFVDVFKLQYTYMRLVRLFIFCPGAHFSKYTFGQISICR